MIHESQIYLSYPNINNYSETINMLDLMRLASIIDDDEFIEMSKNIIKQVYLK